MAAMKMSHEMRYDATPEQVQAMLADPDFRAKVCDYQGVLRHTISITPDGEGMAVVIDQFQAATGIPSFAKKFVGDEIHIVQQENWTSANRADLEVLIPGKPGQMRGSITLGPSGEGTVEQVDVDIKVSIPLVGGKIEGLVRDLLVSALKAENHVGREWLGS